MVFWYFQQRTFRPSSRGISSDVRSIYKDPLHPYTVGLLKSIPKLHEEQDKLYNIKGSIPSPQEFPKGCRFSPRCEECMDI